MSEFKTYEYVTVTAKRKDEALYTDCYRNFGWSAAEGRDAALPNPEKVSLKLRRDRKLEHRREINALQQKCEQALATISALDAKKSRVAIMASMAFGLVGTVFMGVSVFNISVFTVNIPLVIIFGALGLIGWMLGYFSYVKVNKSQAAKISPLIEQQYDIVYNTCEEAGTLLG